MEMAKLIFQVVDPGITYQVLKQDGEKIQKGDIALTAQGDVRSLLRAERVVLELHATDERHRYGEQNLCGCSGGNRKHDFTIPEKQLPV
jgi:hypothetical protein